MREKILRILHIAMKHAVTPRVNASRLSVYRIEDGVAAGTNLTFTINANYVTSFFDGTKSLVISTTNDMGGRNPYWGQSFLTLGVAIWILAALGAVSSRITFSTNMWFSRCTSA